MSLLIINRNDLQWTTGNGQYVLTPPEDRVLITRMFAGGLNGWRSEDYLATQVVQMGDLEHLYRVGRWSSEHWKVNRVLALHEKDQLLAARIRDELGIAGPGVAQVLPYRDKYLMKCRVRDAGILTPRFFLLSDPELQWSGASVSKDRWGLGADSIRWWATPDEAVAEAATIGLKPDETLVEERVFGEMYYCDAVVLDGQTVFSHVSEYVVKPGDYQDFDWQADISPVPSDVQDVIIALNERVLDALGRYDGVTHAEYFRDPEGNVLFCEIAGRPGGGGVDLVVRHTTGVDLIEVAVAIAEQRQPDLRPVEPTGVNVLLGLYPSPRAIPIEDLRGVRDGVVHHESYTHAHLDHPRHANDYTDLLMLHAATKADALALMDDVLRLSGRSAS